MYLIWVAFEEYEIRKSFLKRYIKWSFGKIRSNLRKYELWMCIMGKDVGKINKFMVKIKFCVKKCIISIKNMESLALNN